MKKKIILIAAAVLAVIICVAGTILGWNWYDANVDRSGWVEEEGKTYYKNFYGDRVTGWQDIDGKTYYFADDNTMHTGWLEQDGKKYYLNADGTLATGWQNVDGKRYFLRSDGTAVSGWLDLEGSRYYLNQDGSAYSGWLTVNEHQYYIDSDGRMATGWIDIDGQPYCFTDTGAPASGWAERDGQTYYLNDDGTLYTGWLQDGEYSYYLQSDGTPATGKTEIDGNTYYFGPQGIHILLVNLWNAVPDDYAPELITVADHHRVAAACYDALIQMLSDCEAAGNTPAICSAYRTQEEQEYLFDRKVKFYTKQGYPEEEAKELASISVAVPGTSEHQLGLAVDIVAHDYWVLDDSQATTKAQIWLMEHCWEYGFILRYTEEKMPITGIIYEPWHYRYVGVEVAMDIRDSGLCLEEYVGTVNE